MRICLRIVKKLTIVRFGCQFFQQPDNILNGISFEDRQFVTLRTIAYFILFYFVKIH